MPYGKYRSRRRYSYKRRRGGSALKKATTALRKVRKLEKKQETKTHYIALFTQSNVTTAGVVGNIGFVAQGDATRDGNKISPYLLRITLHWLGDAAGVDDVYRSIIYWDTKTVKGATAAVTDVLMEANSLSMLKHDNRGRFIILYDQCFTGSNDASVRLSFIAKLRIKLNKSILYDGPLASDIVKNGLYMIHITNTSANHPDLSYTFQLDYNDN